MNSLTELAGGRPLLVWFVKDGCPCSVEAAGFYQRLYALYREHVRFAAVIDGGPEVAR